MSSHTTPTPDLRIIPIDAPKPHEEHDSQRSAPLIERLRKADHITNPPIVAELDAETYVILDGANRCFSLAEIGLPHIMVQVVPYTQQQVQLSTWNHVVSRWNADELLRQARTIVGLELKDGNRADALAHIILRDNRMIALLTDSTDIHERNAFLRQFVAIYQRNAVLNRTPFSTSEDVWHLFSEANALIRFPAYEPYHIMDAARHQAFLPPGISRHIVQGRALGVNYPMSQLWDTTHSLEQKNKALNEWITQKLANREIRYYAEATYQFSE
jgi:hypothetical protein